MIISHSRSFSKSAYSIKLIVFGFCVTAGGNAAGQSSSDVLSLDVRGSSINNPLDAAELLEETENIQDMIHSQWGTCSQVVVVTKLQNSLYLKRVPVNTTSVEV